MMYRPYPRVLLDKWLFDQHWQRRATLNWVDFNISEGDYYQGGLPSVATHPLSQCRCAAQGMKHDDRKDPMEADYEASICERCGHEEPLTGGLCNTCDIWYSTCPECLEITPIEGECEECQHVWTGKSVAWDPWYPRGPLPDDLKNRKSLNRRQQGKES